MSHNKSRDMLCAVSHLDNVISIDKRDGHALPGSVVKLVKQARKKLLKDIRKRRDARKREDIRSQPDELT